MEQVTCVVCCELLFSEDFIVASTCCHIFHKKCLENWIEKSATCPECRAECLRGSSRRLFFNSDPRDSEFKQKELQYQEQIITLQNEIASTKEQFQDQLNAEMQIKENMHAKIKMLEEKIGKLAGLTSSSPQTEKSEVTNSSSLQAVTTKPQSSHLNTAAFEAGWIFKPGCFLYGDMTFDEFMGKSKTHEFGFGKR